ncbi:MAG TPA: hypothetical protein VGR57_17130, partial [Ktedonobacterales bacterium]|nr:hypothetical protein [Ktedonobacterales bacterium]
TGAPLPEASILDWVIPVCGALHTLHTSPVPIIHRDVKPANVKITRLGDPILIDLGLAKLYARGTKTIGAALAFTPGYAPPEQYRASGATDARTDIYGMGASLFYLLTGYQPTEAPARIGALALPPLRQLNPAISRPTEAAVLRALELDPTLRQQSALELEHALRAARTALRPTGAATQSSATFAAAPAASTPPAAPVSAEPSAAPGDPPSATPSGPAPEAPAWHPDAAWIVGQAPVEQVPAELAASAVPATPPVAPPPLAPAVPVARVETQIYSHFEVMDDDPQPDQPAIVMPPLRAGPAPAAKPLRPPEAAAPPLSLGAVAAQHRASAGRPYGPAAAPRPVVPHLAPEITLDLGALARRALPSLRRWHQETVAAAPATEAEARTSIASVMAVVLAALTLTAVHDPLASLLALPAPLALVAALPALALGHWCLQSPSARPIAEARWLATAALVIVYSWLALYALGAIILKLHHG